ncbi:MAG: FtsL-like putative cell division protein [Candidatus Cryptobacteroides sp.]|nr:hypothetical protein [Bacteroidales bacterium]MDD7088128.1 FtsL-like putative cell division protein [Bacteroidales bacterium]MDY2936124.1 FtsL-like putative cell division protein [Candidatus Cryptobacteroides sp.]MEE3389661.1 FtsL-like putative cell division protein [Candidatus Cryptobacteroides sp.]MEE3430314.1 FtsL-like putative cell division protein [Candidatus Cryptobacteroides sp.]
MAETAEHKKWRLSDIGQWLKNAFFATLKGEFLLRLQIDRYFIHIIYTIFLIWLSIWISLKMEKTFIKVEQNRKELENVKIYRAQKTIEMASLGRMSKVQEKLEEKGSKLTNAEKPAYKISSKQDNKGRR